MSRFLVTLRQMARMMVGIPDYDAYLRHMASHHPDHPAMDRNAFFRERQDARYEGASGGKCC
ncbi:YbdD/YjiX family protein [Sphingobium sp. LMA1-1-1.1]|uniref:YbdD/YjiX family protein n=1 Tax=Sphingobium sp. LMA1-1-1.1 TaxID=3135238 RepID=UPI00342E23E4